MEALRVQGRLIAAQDLAVIRQLLVDQPEWGRTRLASYLCELWQWRNPAGQLKDMAARSLLRKLHERGLIDLPPPRSRNNNALRRRGAKSLVLPQRSLSVPLAACRPLVLSQVRSPQQRQLLAEGFARLHYLGFVRPVGENIGYLVYDAKGRWLASVLFGAAAWKLATRDEYIGWSTTMRQERLSLVANNSRLLIVPGVRVPHLASHLLGILARRLSQDWQAKYGHPIVLLESFVQTDRFAGTCYRAANWIHLGRTTGRTRQDRQHCRRVPIKDIYVYPLCRKFRRHLGVADSAPTLNAKTNP